MEYLYNENRSETGKIFIKAHFRAFMRPINLALLVFLICVFVLDSLLEFIEKSEIF